jgi:hypothetical protein
MVIVSIISSYVSTTKRHCSNGVLAALLIISWSVIGDFRVSCFRTRFAVSQSP